MNGGEISGSGHVSQDGPALAAAEALCGPHSSASTSRRVKSAWLRIRRARFDAWQYSS